MAVLLLATAGMPVGCARPQCRDRGVAIAADLPTLDPQVRAHLEEIIARARRSPRDPSTHATLGIAYAANDHWGEALECFGTVACLAPDDPMGWYYVAIAERALGNFDAALEGLELVVERFPDFSPARHRLGDALLEAGDIDAAEAAFREVVVLAPNAPEGYVGLAELELRRQDFPAAAELAGRALSLRPDLATAHYLLGRAYRGLDRSVDAERELSLGVDAKKSFMPEPWSRVMVQHAKDISNQLRLAGDYLRAGDTASAIALLETAASWHPQEVNVLNDLGIAYVNLFRAEAPQRRDLLEKARDLFLRSAEIDQTRYTTFVNLAAVLLDLGLLDEALAQVDRGVALAPESAQAHFTRFGILARMGRTPEAVAALAEAVRLDPQNPQLRSESARFAMGLGRAEEAREHLKALVELTPADLAAQARLCELSLSLGHLEDAERALEALRRVAPDDPVVRGLDERLRSLTGEAG